MAITFSGVMNCARRLGYLEFIMKSLQRNIVVSVVSLLACQGLELIGHAAAFDFARASRAVPKPREIWPMVKQFTVPLEFTVISDEIVVSDTDPSKRLRKVTAHFWSQKLAGKKWGHRCVIFLPADNSPNLTPKRKGKVAIIGSPPYAYFPVHVDKYGETIAARTGYPTMVLSNPGEYPDGSAIEHDIGVLNRLRKETGENYYHMNCQLAVVYIQAMNGFQQFLGCDRLAIPIRYPVSGIQHPIFVPTSIPPKSSWRRPRKERWHPRSRPFAGRLCCRRTV